MSIRPYNGVNMRYLFLPNWKSATASKTSKFECGQHLFPCLCVCTALRCLRFHRLVWALLLRQFPSGDIALTPSVSRLSCRFSCWRIFSIKSLPKRTFVNPLGGPLFAILTSPFAPHSRRANGTFHVLDGPQMRALIVGMLVALSFRRRIASWVLLTTKLSWKYLANRRSILQDHFWPLGVLKRYRYVRFISSWFNSKFGSKSRRWTSWIFHGSWQRKRCWPGNATVGNSSGCCHYAVVGKLLPLSCRWISSASISLSNCVASGNRFRCTRYFFRLQFLSGRRSQWASCRLKCGGVAVATDHLHAKTDQGTRGMGSCRRCCSLLYNSHGFHFAFAEVLVVVPGDTYFNDVLRRTAKRAEPLMMYDCLAQLAMSFQSALQWVRWRESEVMTFLILELPLMRLRTGLHYLKVRLQFSSSIKKPSPLTNTHVPRTWVCFRRCWVLTKMLAVTLQNVSMTKVYVWKRLLWRLWIMPKMRWVNSWLPLLSQTNTA